MQLVNSFQRHAIGTHGSAQCAEALYSLVCLFPWHGKVFSVRIQERSVVVHRESYLLLPSFGLLGVRDRALGVYGGCSALPLFF